jgi:hypothetical protein
MRWRRKRTTPTATELLRVEKVLARDLALRRYLGPKTTPVRKRNGDLVYFAPETMLVVQELTARKLSPERAHVRMVLRVGADVLRGKATLSGTEFEGA